MAEMIQVQVEGTFRLEREKWYRVETYVREGADGTREFRDTAVADEGSVLGQILQKVTYIENMLEAGVCGAHDSPY